MFIQKKPVIVASLFLFIQPLAYAVDISLNVQEMSHLDQQTVGGLEDVWGWYDQANSKYYALACNGHDTMGVIVIETTDPQYPQIRGVLSHGVIRHAVDVMVRGDYAFVTSQLSDPSEIWIYYLPTAVANPTLPPARVITLIDGIRDTLNYIYPLNNSHNVFLDGNLLFLPEMYTTQNDPYEVAVIDVSDPASPRLLNVWADSLFDAVYKFPHDIYVRGTTAYIFAFLAGVYEVHFTADSALVIGWKKIWYDRIRGDVANNYPYGTFQCPDSNETRIIPKEPFTHSGWLTGDGQYLLVADEGGNEGYAACQALAAPCLRVFNVNDFWDVNDPARDTTVNPVSAFDILWNADSLKDKSYVGASIIDQVAPNSTPCPTPDCLDALPPDYGTLGIHNPHIKGRLAFMAWYARGLQVLDITEISNMKHAGFFDHGNGVDGNWVQEAYSEYPLSPDGYIYQGGVDGLYIYQLGVTGTLASSATWYGDNYIYDTLTVSSNQTLRLAAGANVYLYKDALLKVNGKLVASGTSSDSVKFICLGGNLQPGDWRGIYVDQAAVCSLSYCSISNAEYGLESRTDAAITILNSNFHDNKVSGIYSYKSYTKVKYSRFENNGTAGVDALNADVDVYGSRFVDNALYGIRLVGTWTTDSTLIEYDTLSCSPTPSQYAISITDIDRARVYKCKARSYSLAGLYLSGSDALVKNNDFPVKKNVRKITFCLTNSIITLYNVDV